MYRATTGLTIIEPLIVMGMALIAYFTAELFHWSGILSLIACGVTQVFFKLII